MADAKATRALQQMLKDAGFYSGPIDGAEGDQTRAAKAMYDAHAKAEAAKSAQATARANADAAAAGAKAEEAKANAEAIKAKAQTEKAAADAIKRSDEASAATKKMLFDTGVTVTAYAAGVAAGTKTVKGIDAKLAEGLANKNRELRKLASDVAPMIEKVDKAGTSKKAASLVERTLSKIDAIVGTADKIGLTKVGRGPAGPIAAVGAIAIGAVSRTAAQHVDNETVQTVLNASGTAEIVAGAVIGVKDLASRAAPTKTVDAKALSTIEQGRNLVKAAQGVEAAAAEVAPLATRVLKLAGKVALPLTVGMAVIQGARGYAKDGVRGAARGVIDSVDPTSILPGMDGKGLAERIFDRFAGSANLKAADVSAARKAAAIKAADREHKIELTPMTSTPASSSPSGHLDQASTPHMSDGMTAAYQRRGVNGKMISVQGYATPSRSK